MHSQIHSLTQNFSCTVLIKFQRSNRLILRMKYLFVLMMSDRNSSFILIPENLLIDPGVIGHELIFRKAIVAY